MSNSNLGEMAAAIRASATMRRPAIGIIDREKQRDVEAEGLAELGKRLAPDYRQYIKDVLTAGSGAVKLSDVKVMKGCTPGKSTFLGAKPTRAWTFEQIRLRPLAAAIRSVNRDNQKTA